MSGPKVETGDAVIITPEQAESLIVEGDDVHTFVSAAFGLVGADHSRRGILADIRAAERIDLSGPMARAMGHGICLRRKGQSPLFVRTNDAKMDAFDPPASRSTEAR